MADETYEAWVVTASDRCAAGEREDASGPAVRELLERAGYRVTRSFVVPDERPQIADALRHAAAADVALVVTTGGTGFSPAFRSLNTPRILPTSDCLKASIGSGGGIGAI